MSTNNPLVQPELEVIVNEPGRSFRWYKHGHTSALAKWNYHPEYELHLITQTSGTLFVGDCIEKFSPGNLCLIGPNLPHNWSSKLKKNEVVSERDIVIQFTEKSIGLGSELMPPELLQLKKLLDKSHLGLSFSGPCMTRVIELMKAMEEQSGLAAYASFLTILALLSDEAEARVLASPHYQQNLNKKKMKRLQTVFEKVTNNIHEDIKLKQFANQFGMTESTFSKFFLKSCGMNFSEYLRKMRIGQACYLLSDSTEKIIDVCNDSGFRNLSNFNRIFKEKMNMTPSQYRTLSRKNKGDVSS
jgi:AraC-like DNA-binding protein